MRLVLMRHGPPQFDVRQRMRARDLGLATAAYRCSPLRADAQATAQALAVAQPCRYVLCSDLLRARQSLERLGVVANHHDALFNESDLPYWPLPGPALSLSSWAVIFRLLSLLGLQRHGEAVSRLRQRAGQAASCLVEHAQVHGEVLLMGHGLMNHFIGKSLRQRGWQRIEHQGHDHWAFSVYALQRDTVSTSR